MCILGASIDACMNVNRHNVALEEDKVIFDALMTPLARAKATPPSPRPSISKRSQDPDTMEILLTQIKRRCQSK